MPIAVGVTLHACTGAVNRAAVPPGSRQGSTVPAESGFSAGEWTVELDRLEYRRLESGVIKTSSTLRLQLHRSPGLSWIDWSWSRGVSISVPCSYDYAIINIILRDLHTVVLVVPLRYSPGVRPCTHVFE